MYRTVDVFHLCFQYMDSPYKRSISSLGTTHHTLQIFLICCHDLYSGTCICMFGCDLLIDKRCVQTIFELGWIMERRKWFTARHHALSTLADLLHVELVITGSCGCFSAVLLQSSFSLRPFSSSDVPGIVLYINDCKRVY